MTSLPQTSTTLLRDLASDTQHARWGEFVARYRPMMEAYIADNFPSLEADDVVQETLISLIRVFPVYHYVPEEKGHFHNYLTGILRHKALRLLSAETRHQSHDEAYARDLPTPGTDKEIDYKRWRDSTFEIALQQYLADETVNDLTKQVFLRLAVNGDKPNDIARDFGIERNAVDQIKSRAMSRLRELVKALERVDDANFDS